MGKAKPTVVLIDDSAEVRSLIKARLGLSGLLTVVADGANGNDAIGLAYRFQPTLLLLDMSMPSMDGLEALPGILTVAPDTRVVVYSGFEEGGLAARAREMGAAAFLEKSLPIDQLAGELLAVLPPEQVPSSPRALSVVTDDPDGHDDQSLLGEHLERFREVFDEAAIGMATMTLTGSVVRANRALGSLVGCKHEELVGVDYATLTSGAGELLDAALDDIVERSTDLVHFEHAVAGASDERRLRATLAPVRDSRGEPLYVFLQAQDITMQRAALEELRQSEERFRLLVEAVEDYAIFMLSPEGVVVSWNAGAERNKGYRAEEIIGQHFRVFYEPEQRRRKRPERVLAMALRDGQYEEEGWRLRKDGSRFWANVLVTPVFNKAGEHLGFAKITRDRSEARRAEQEKEEAAAELADANIALQALNSQLQQAAADQSQFLAVTAHELRTPAAVLSGSATTLARHWPELARGDRESLLRGMVTSADRLRRLLAELLTVSRLDANSLRLRPEASSLSGILATAVDAARGANQDAQIIVEDHVDIEVLADPDRLAQAIDNLIGNAVRHGAPPVRVAVDADGPMAMIHVSDSGDGVDPEVVPRLFERFATGDDLVGTGLGLFIVRELARAHGGDAIYEPGSSDHPIPEFVLSIPQA